MAPHERPDPARQPGALGLARWGLSTGGEGPVWRASRVAGSRCSKWAVIAGPGHSRVGTGQGRQSQRPRHACSALLKSCHPPPCFPVTAPPLPVPAPLNCRPPPQPKAVVLNIGTNDLTNCAWGAKNAATKQKAINREIPGIVGR